MSAEDDGLEAMIFKDRAELNRFLNSAKAHKSFAESACEARNYSVAIEEYSLSSNDYNMVSSLCSQIQSKLEDWASRRELR